MTIETKRRVAKGLQLGLVVGVLVGLSGLIQTAWLADPIPALAQTVTVDSTQSPLVVNALADLANLTPTDGQSVIIKTGTEKGLWYYDKDSVAVVDSVAVLTGPGSVGRFLVINNDAGSIAAATPITAAQIDNDVDLEFGVFDADSARSLTLAELKKTGVQVYNVLQYGAVGDGTTDDTAAIQAALDAASAARAASTYAAPIVYLPPGEYKTTDELDFDGRLHFRGSGINATVIKFEPATGSTEDLACLSVKGGPTSNDYIYFPEVSDLSISLVQGAAQTAVRRYGVYLLYPTRAFVHDLEVKSSAAITSKDWIGLAYGTWTNGTWTYEVLDTP